MKHKILGLDLGVTSIGWNLSEENDENQQIALIDIGSRIFEAGLDGDIEKGKGDSPCAERRQCRMTRRRLKRRRQRKHKLLRVLKAHGLLPETPDLAQAIQAIDAEELTRLLREQPKDLPAIKYLPQVLPYYLRTQALDRALPPFVLGRAIYHLAQRRGFLSNSRLQASLEGDEDSGKVKKGISDLRKAMESLGARTLGEYFCRQNPDERTIRRRWTDRAMFKDEFEQICKAQGIGDALKKELYDAIFYQRPLQSAKNLIGKCSLEKGQRRAPLYHPAVERFTMLQALNHLRVEESDGTERPLSAEERKTLIAALCGEGDLLEKSGKLSITKAKKLLGLKRTTKFSIEKSDEKHIPGCFFEWKMRGIFGERWETFSAEKKAEVLHDAISIVKESTRLKRAKGYWQLPDQSARLFADLSFKDGYASLSLKAIRTLLSDLEAGIDYANARKNHYPESFEATTAQATLPPVNQCLSDLRNPLVNRVLTQLRHVVNAVIAKHGKPDFIRIELARDLKNSAKEREKIFKESRTREKARDAARDEILKALPNSIPTPRDLLKVLLWKECEETCPYTGAHIGIAELLSGQYDIEHIIPYSRSLDNSFNNLTLCDAMENRNIKQNKTPHEAYGASPEKYEAILQRVRRFRNQAKLHRFEMDTLEDVEAMPSRLLNDTRYASRLAMEYLGILYGGVIDKEGTRRIQASKGAITALLRKEFGLNNLLGNGEKTREDHRHHAVDAVAIALASPARIKRLTDIFKQLSIQDRQKIFKDPWLRTGSEDFLKSVGAAIKAIQTSHYAPSRVRGALHEQTLYGKDRDDPRNPKKKIKHQRVALNKLSEKDIATIIDGAIRKRVQDCLSAAGIKDPAKYFSIEENLPTIENAGDVQKIRAVRITTTANTTPVGQGDRQRHVMLGSNHHVAVVATLDESGKEIQWEGHVVSQLEAQRRKHAKEPIVCRTWDTDEKGRKRIFKFSLTQKDVVRFKPHENSEPDYFVVRSIGSAGQHAFVRLNDARLQKEIKTKKEWVTSCIDPLRLKACEKFKMTPLGELRRAHD